MQQAKEVQQAIFSPLKKDQITRGDRKESLIRRIQLLLLENLVLGKKSNQQTKKNGNKKRITSQERTTKEKKTTQFFSKPGRVYEKTK